MEVNELIENSSFMKEMFDVIVNNSALNISKFNKVKRINRQNNQPKIQFQLVNFSLWKKHFS